MENDVCILITPGAGRITVALFLVTPFSSHLSKVFKKRIDQSGFRMAQEAMRNICARSPTSTKAQL